MQDRPYFYPKCQLNLKLKNQLMCTCQSIACSHGNIYSVGADGSEPIWSGLLKKNRPGRPSEIICFSPEHSSVALTGHNHTLAKAPSVSIIFYYHSSFLILLFSQKLLNDLQSATESGTVSYSHTGIALESIPAVTGAKAGLHIVMIYCLQLA